MINVKSIRSGAPKVDPADPLSFKPPPEPATRLLSSWAVGLVSLGLYIKSFLWREDAAPALAAEPQPHDTTPNAVPRAVEPLAFNSGAEDSGQDDAKDSHDLAVSYYQLPVAIVSFGGSFAPLPIRAIPSTTEPFSANSSVPPFVSATGRVPVIEGTPGRDSGDAAISLDMDQVILVNDTPPTETQLPAKGPGKVIRPDFGGPGQPSGPPAMPTQPPVEAVNEEDEEEDDTDDGTDPVVPARNLAPRNAGPVMLGDIGSAAALAFTLDHFLSQTTDADGDPLQISGGQATSGALIPKGDGWRYFADRDHLGEVRITYTISDGEFAVAQTAILNVVENAFTGTDTDDLIIGTQGRDAIEGLGGDDLIAGMDGRDRIFGGDGSDNIAGGDGDDMLYGGDGDDIIAGGRGHDVIFGGDGDDRLYGDAGNDVIHGEAGHDKAFGGQGRDWVDGGDGDDSLFGGDGDDVILGAAGDDKIAGDDGHDMLYGGAGQDVLSGGTGNDTVDGGAGRDILHGDAGSDTLHGGSDDDILSGGADNDILSGDDGDDQLWGDDGEDVIFGGTGQDVVFGGAQADVIFGGSGGDRIAGDAGNDILSGEDGKDVVFGGEGDDVLSGGDGSDEVHGGDGDDIVLGDDDTAEDHYDGGDGTDVLTYANASEGVAIDLIDDIVTGLSVGTDTIANFEGFVGSTQDDSFVAGQGTGVLTGNGGADLYNFVQGDTVTLVQSVYSITDFDDDDRIWISRGESQHQVRRAQASLEDRIEDGFEDYADQIGSDEPRLVFHHDWTDAYRRTVIEVDFDRDDTIDLEILISGEHMLLVEQA
jgi:Ca2+-binding RTX toxin-like protein